ncbi:hypothetical protein BDR05DRAFT_1030648 [Suillus weaverae]|nr:hypothetical protein BDR05DRAFT_1030648 [Suillus weaverae]
MTRASHWAYSINFTVERRSERRKKTGYTAFSYSDLEKVTDGGDLIPPVDDQDDNGGREQEEEAVSVAEEEEESASGQLDEFDKFLLGIESEASSEDGADYLTGAPAAPVPKLDSPFHPNHYPSPYPFIPCTHDEIPILQQRVPLHLLQSSMFMTPKLPTEETSSEPIHSPSHWKVRRSRRKRRNWPSWQKTKQRRKRACCASSPMARRDRRKSH